MIPCDVAGVTCRIRLDWSAKEAATRETARIYRRDIRSTRDTFGRYAMSLWPVVESAHPRSIPYSVLFRVGSWSAQGCAKGTLRAMSYMIVTWSTPQKIKYRRRT